MTESPQRRAREAFEALAFRWPWRPHQRRMLDAVDEHLEDDRLHLVAAPGAGKTSLGLEVVRRLGKPTLIVAPTLTIRDQWLSRLSDFLPDGGPVPDWATTDVDHPRIVTATTYQGLLSRSRPKGDPAEDEASEGEGAEVIEPDLSPNRSRELMRTLRSAAIETIVLDEAHHLRREWWKALDELVEGLAGVTLVSLTATPPFDATGWQWRRYEALCGPIDEEISAPELVRVGTLCPHQDFVYVVPPSRDDVSLVREHDARVHALLGDLLEDPAALDQIATHPWAQDPDVDAASVLDRPEVAVAILVLLRVGGVVLPERLLDLLAIRSEELPLPSRRWWEVALRELLFSDDWPDRDEGLRRRLQARMKAEGLLAGRELRICSNRRIATRLAAAPAKVTACVAIHEAERAVRGEGLRQIFLTDYIRDDGAFSFDPGADERLGAWPLFRALVMANRDGNAAEVGLVTGRLAAVHRSRLQELTSELTDSSFETRDLVDGSDWCRILNAPSGRLVQAFSALFERGALRTLVGTRGLLGEGWDAPRVNSVVLASYVGAFVTTNQMRGRALRSDPEDPDKVASVWHLAACEPGTEAGLEDLEALEQRFRTFVGLSRDGRSIESGLARLQLPPLGSAADVEAAQVDQLEQLRSLDRIAGHWKTAIGLAHDGRVVPTLSLQRPPTLRPFVFRRTLSMVLAEAGLAAAFAAVRSVPDLLGSAALRTGMSWLLAGAFLAALPPLFRWVRLAARHAPVDGSVRQIARATFEALRECGVIGKRGRTLELNVEPDPSGGVAMSVSGGSFYDQSAFADAVGECLGPVENPRYLVTRTTRGLFGKRVDYHAVPRLLDRDKNRAETFLSHWQRHVGPATLIYTRREGGRRALLAARGRAFANNHPDAGVRVDRWQ